MVSLVSSKKAAIKANGRRSEEAPVLEKDGGELHVFFINTTKSEKIDHLNAAAEKYHYKALFLPVSALGKPSHSPQELEGSFKGNKNQKLKSLARHLSQFSPEQVTAAMTSLGFSEGDIGSKIKLYGVAEDSGLSFHRDMPKRLDAQGRTPDEQFVAMFLNDGPDGPYTRVADKEMVRKLRESKVLVQKADPQTGKSVTVKTGEFYREGEPFPGVETVNVMGAGGGVENLFRLLNLTMKKMNMEIDPGSPNARPGTTLQFKDASVLGAFEWHPHERNASKPKFLNFHESDKDKGISFSVYDGTGFSEGKAEQTHVQRLAAKHGERTTYGGSIPRHRAARGDFTNRDELDLIFKPLARTEAFKSLMAEYGIPKQGRKAWDEYVEHRGFDLGSNLSGRPFKVALLPGNGPHGVLRNHMKEALHDAGMTVHLHRDETLNGNGHLRHRRRGSSDLDAMQRMIETNDAYIFMAGKGEGLDALRQHKLEHAMSNAIIHKMLDPAGKPKLILVVAEDRKAFQPMIDQLESMFNHGALGDRPSEMIKIVHSVAEAEKEIVKHRARYRPPLVEAEAKTPVPDLKDETGTYNVCVFLSASMQGIYQDKAEALGKRLQAEGMTTNYGAADRHMMGGLYDGVLAAAKKRKEPPRLIGSTTPVISATECEHGVKPAQLEDKWFYLAPDITKRREFLFKNSHAFVLMEGGVGTLDELQTYIHYKESQKKSEASLVKNKPMIITESAYTQEPIFKTVLNRYLAPELKRNGVSDIAKLDDKSRERIFESTGIMIMRAPERIPEGSTKKLYEIEMDNVIELLKKHRDTHYPHLIPGTQENQSFMQMVAERREAATPPTLRP